jgi:hypothetical protein
VVMINSLNHINFLVFSLRIFKEKSSFVLFFFRTTERECEGVFIWVFFIIYTMILIYI